MFSKSYWWKSALAAAFMTAAWAGTYGSVVAIGGQASSLALDEPRGVLYIANFTANRIDVMSLANNTIQTSINVAQQPSSLALSPDGKYLVVTHFGNATPPASSSNAVTVINMVTTGQQTFALANAPLGVAFGMDGLALVVTTTDFQLLDPVSGSTRELDTISGVVANQLPQPPASFPPNIVAATVGASADGSVIYGFSDTLLFRYDVGTKSITSALYTSTPTLGPRAISVSKTGSYFTAGWTLKDRDFYNISQFPNVSGALNVGTTAIDSAHNVIYAQIPPPGTPLPAPTMQVVASDNLTVLKTINLPENFAGSSVLSSDGSMLYGVSDSGVMVLNVGALSQAHQITANKQDLVFRGNFCDRSVATQSLTITDPSGGKIGFSISSDTTGLSVTPSSGTTPATVTVTVDPNVFQNQQGTVVANLSLQSGQAVNVGPSVRVLINSRQPSQRGTFVDIPGTLVDLLADPNTNRNRYYVLRQDQNQVLVFNGANNTQIATLRTGNTPKGMAITFDQRYLLVGCDNSHYLNVFDLETLKPVSPVRMFNGDYVQSVASSSNAILAATRNASGGDPSIHRIDLITGSSSKLPSLGVYQNKIALNSVLTASSNGSSILMVSSDGHVMLYDANSNTFTVSRQDFTALSGAYAASNFNYYVAGNNLLDASLVPITQLDPGAGSSSGFAFQDPAAFRSSSASTNGGQSSAPGTIERVDLSIPNSPSSLSTQMVEAPLVGTATAAFTRTIAPLPNQSAIINLTVSGVTILPPNYDAAVALPHISKVVSAADSTPNIAPGGLITLFGTDLSPVNMATDELPLPTAVANSCLTINGLPMPILFVSPNQVNAQMPFEAIGNETLILRTPGGTSNNYSLQVLPNAPTVFHVLTPNNISVPTVVRNDDGQLVTDSHPIHRKGNEALIIYTTGLGATSPAVPSGTPAPSDPLAVALTVPTVTLGGVELPLLYYGLAPGEVGVYQINVTVPRSVPDGFPQPLVITQGSRSTSVGVRVVD